MHSQEIEYIYVKGVGWVPKPNMKRPLTGAEYFAMSKQETKDMVCYRCGRVAGMHFTNIEDRMICVLGTTEFFE